jgi:AhpD family alkylhydroperoxidase
MESAARLTGATPEALVSPVEPAQAPLLARAYYGSSRVSPIVSSLAHVPEALDVTMPFVACVLGPSAIAARTKELVIVRTSGLLECRYCVQTHSAVALDRGVTTDEVLALRGDRPWEERFERPEERALLTWVDAVAGGRGTVAAEAAEGMKAHHSDAGVVELTLLCATTMMLNRYCTALELPTSPGTLERLAAEGLL